MRNLSGMNISKTIQKTHFWCGPAPVVVLSCALCTTSQTGIQLGTVAVNIQWTACMYWEQRSNQCSVWKYLWLWYRIECNFIFGLVIFINHFRDTERYTRVWYMCAVWIKTKVKAIFTETETFNSTCDRNPPVQVMYLMHLKLKWSVYWQHSQIFLLCASTGEPLVSWMPLLIITWD